MKIRIVDNGFEKHSDLFKKVIEERIPYEAADDGMQIELCIDKEIGKEESFVIESEKNSFKITGADDRGLYYGIGKFLHTTRWSEDDFVPNPPDEIVAPESSFRAIYFAVHFNNWYDEGPTEELEKYLEELLLYGYNAIVCIIPIVSINSYEDEFFTRAVTKTRTIFKLAKKLSMKVGIIVNPNQGMMNAPHEWDADPSYEQTDVIYRGQIGRNLCPSIPEAYDYLRAIWRKEFEQYTDIGLDYVMTWPYDEGGCGCDKCRPWGAKGYCELAIGVHKDAKEFYPESKFILSTWVYDTPNDEGEFSGLYERLQTDMKFVDYIMVDSHDQFPRYPLEHELVKPIVNFPEISMWRLFPWGGRGANPMPKRFQQIWDSAKEVLSGGMPYSEGMYEDILKIQTLGYYWDKNKHYKDILSEYINYEYSSEVIEDVIEMMELIEANHVKVGKKEDPDLQLAYRAEHLADKVEAILSKRAKKAWRWRILYIRTKIDRIIYEYFFEEGKNEEDCYRKLRKTPETWLKGSEEAQKLMQELCKYYHCVDIREDRMNQYTLPSVINGKVQH